MENFKKFTLDNGINLFVENVPTSRSVAIKIFCNKGSTLEKKGEYGWAHFTEHMLFKGTKTKSYKQLSETFDNMGPYNNAATSYNYIALYNRMPSEYLIEYLENAFDMINNAAFEQKELDLERQVVLNEMKMSVESPEDKLDDDFMTNIYKNSPLGHTIIGDHDCITSVSQSQLFDFYQNAFIAENLNVYIVGNIDIDKIKAFIENVPVRHGVGVQPPKITVSKPNEHIFYTTRDCQQLHVMLGTNQFEASPSEMHALDLLNGVLADGMSSRLFYQVREKLGLCYQIESMVRIMRNSNYFKIYFSTKQKENLNKAIDAISNVIKDIKKNNITKEELEKEINKTVNLAIIDSDSLQIKLGIIRRSFELYNRYVPIEETIDKIKAITLDDIANVVDKLFVKDNFVTQILYKEPVECNGLDF